MVDQSARPRSGPGETRRFGESPFTKGEALSLRGPSDYLRSTLTLGQLLKQLSPSRLARTRVVQTPGLQALQTNIDDDETGRRLCPSLRVVLILGHCKSYAADARKSMEVSHRHALTTALGAGCRITRTLGHVLSRFRDPLATLQSAAHARHALLMMSTVLVAVGRIVVQVLVNHLHAGR